MDKKDNRSQTPLDPSGSRAPSGPPAGPILATLWTDETNGAIFDASTGRQIGYARVSRWSP